MGGRVVDDSVLAMLAQVYLLSDGMPSVYPFDAADIISAVRIALSYLDSVC